MSARSARRGAFPGEATESQDCGGRRIADDVLFVGHGWEDIGEDDGIAGLAMASRAAAGAKQSERARTATKVRIGVVHFLADGNKISGRQKQYSKSRFLAQNGEIVKVND